MEEKELKSPEKVLEPAAKKKIIAQKSFVISQNGYFREIKSGEDISDVPDVYLPNLKTESVI